MQNYPLESVSFDNELSSVSSQNYPLYGISELLESRGMYPPYCIFAKAMKEFKYKAKKIFTGGSESVVFRLENDTILKILDSPLIFDNNTRVFDPEIDIPILERGEVSTTFQEFHFPIKWLIQPLADMSATESDLIKFKKLLSSKNYVFEDEYIKNIGFYNDKLLLVDYNAVTKRK